MHNIELISPRFESGELKGLYNVTNMVDMQLAYNAH
jgi:hypothetical protein